LKRGRRYFLTSWVQPGNELPFSSSVLPELPPPNAQHPGTPKPACSMEGEAVPNSDLLTLCRDFTDTSSKRPDQRRSCRAVSHPTETRSSGVMDAGQAWNNLPSGQQLQQKHAVEGLSWCSHRTLALQMQPGTGHSVTEKIREAEKGWVAQVVKTKQVGVVRKRTNKCKEETGKRQGCLSLTAVPDRQLNCSRLSDTAVSGP